MFRSIEGGCARVGVSNSFVVVGSATGTVHCFTHKKWKKTSTSAAPAPQWSIPNLHSAMITSLIPYESHDILFTAGRDGVVTCCRLSDGEERRVLCRMSGEITCLAYDSDRQRLFIAGDMLRYLSLASARGVSVTSVPLAVAPPLASISLSPCGSLIALVSASTGDVRVQSLADASLPSTQPPTTVAETQPPPTTEEAEADAAGLIEFRGVKFSLKGLMSSQRRKDDRQSYHTSWCALMPPDAPPPSSTTGTSATSSGLQAIQPSSQQPAVPAAVPAAAAPLPSHLISYLFAAPSSDGVRLFRFLPLGHSLNKSGRHELLPVHTLTVDDLTDVSYVSLVSPTSKQHRLFVSCVLGGTSSASPSGGARVASVKIHVKKFAVELTGSYEVPNGAPCSAMAVDSVVGGNGSLVLSSGEGTLALLEDCVAVPRQNLLYPTLSAPKGATNNTAAAAVTTTPAAAKTSSQQQQEDVVKASKSKPASESQSAKEKKTKPARQSDEDEDEEEDDDDVLSSDPEQESVDEDEEEEDIGDRKATRKHKRQKKQKKDEGLLTDLLSGNRGYVGRSDDKRVTALRNASSSKKHQIIAEAARRIPSYLDDEAEENDDESEEDEGGSDEGARRYEEDEEEEEAEEGFVDDDAAGFGQRAEDVLEGDDRRHQRSSARNNTGTASTTLMGPANHAMAEKARNYFFQPGATPVTDEAYGTCYLAYNSIGYVRCGVEGIFVGFHDIARPVIKLLERGRVLAAAIGINGVACVMDRSAAATSSEQAEGEADPASSTTEEVYLYVRSFVAYGAQSEWRAPLLPGEVPRCVAVGLQFVALATNFGLRIFSPSGLEKAVLSFPQLIVCMTGANSPKFAQSLKFDEDPLVIAFHPSGSSPLHVQILNVAQASCMLPPTPVAVTRDDEQGDHFLEWLGWSEDGPLHTVDTAGVVRMLSRDWGTSWVPVFDPRHYTVDPTYRYWIWGVSDEYVFVYRTSKGAALSGEPHAPIATAQGFPMDKARLCLPLLRNSGGDKALVGRDRFLRATMKVNELKRQSLYYTEAIAKQDALHDKKVLELFVAALKDQQTTRAVDLVTTLQLLPSVEQAARLANEGGHHSVVQRIVAIVEVRHKLKLRRMCPLPLESDAATDKEKDVLLKRLILKERQQQQQLSGSASSASSAAAAPSASSSVEGGKAAQPSPVKINVKAAAPTSVVLSTTAVEAPTLPPSSSSSRRSVSFADSAKDVKSPSMKPQVNAPPAAASAPAVVLPTLPKKQTSPFATVASPSSAAKGMVAEEVNPPTTSTALRTSTAPPPAPVVHAPSAVVKSSLLLDTQQPIAPAAGSPQQSSSTIASQSSPPRAAGPRSSHNNNNNNTAAAGMTGAPKPPVPSSPPKPLQYPSASTTTSTSRSNNNNSSTAMGVDPFYSTQDSSLENDRVRDVKHYNVFSQNATSEQEEEDRRPLASTTTVVVPPEFNRKPIVAVAAPPPVSPPPPPSPVFQDLHEEVQEGPIAVKSAEELEALAEAAQKTMTASLLESHSSASAKKLGDALRKRYREEDEMEDEDAAPISISFQ